MANCFNNFKMENNPYIQYLQAKKLSKNTIYLYSTFYKRFENYPFTQEGINNFFSNKKTNNTISRAFMKSLLEFLGLEDQFILPPKPTGKKKKRIIRNLTQQQINQIRNLAYNESLTKGFLFDFLYYGALRRSEISKLRVNSLNWSLWFEDPTKPCEIKIELGKGNKDRIVLIPAKVIKHFLEFYMDQQHIKPDNLFDFGSTLNNTGKPIFMQQNGLALKGWTIWKIIKKVSYKAIQIEVRPHELRHARATELEKRGLNIRTIQHYLGHSTPQITEIYLHTPEKNSLSKVKEIMITKDL